MRFSWLGAVCIAGTLTVVALPAAGARSASSVACTKPVPACADWVPLGHGSRIMVYATYRIERPNPRIVRAFIMVHGALRNADHYFKTSTAAAFLAGALDNTIVIAPRFAAAKDRVAPGEVLWPEGAQDWRSGGAIAGDPVLTSFDAMDAIVRALADKRRFPNLRHIVIAGHSAGGQFVTRYEMTNRVHETLGVPVRYVVANPSSYAWPAAVRPLPTGDADPAQAAREPLGPEGEHVNTRFEYGAFDATKAPEYDRWPMGLENRTGYAARSTSDELVRHLIDRPTTYLLGQLDVLPLGGFDSRPNAMAQGPTRRARGEAFYTYLTRALGAKQNAMIVELCGHNDRCIFTTDAVLPIIFPSP